MEIKFDSKTMGTLIIKEIDRVLAKDIIIKNHYSHKWNTSFGKINVGIFKEGNPTCLGVASYGHPMNPKAYKSICTDITQDNFIELNRMWIDDCLGHNAESILISNSFKIIKACYPHIKLIQSFADGRLGCGTIYKATNFKYYGYTETLFFEDLDTGEIYHKVLLENTSRPKAFKKTLDLYLKSRLRPMKVKTYGYIYILDKKLKKKNKMLLKELPYPDYDKGFELVDYKPTLNTLCKYLVYLVYDKEDTSFVTRYLKANYSEKEIKKAIINAKNNKFIKEYIDKNKQDN